MLIVHGDRDGIVQYETGATLARWTGGRVVTVKGGGHALTLRDPVTANLLIRGFAESLNPAPAERLTWTRGRDRRKRALFISSPIGHVRRDLAIAAELRARHNDLLIDWLTQHPVTRVLEERGERVTSVAVARQQERAHRVRRERATRPPVSGVVAISGPAYARGPPGTPCQKSMPSSARGRGRAWPVSRRGGHYQAARLAP